MTHYVAAKEASFTGGASRSYEWYRLLRLAELLELRSHALLYLESAIWKHSLLQYDDDTTFETPEELGLWRWRRFGDFYLQGPLDE
jgi:hypothetical protein